MFLLASSYLSILLWVWLRLFELLRTECVGHHNCAYQSGDCLVNGTDAVAVSKIFEEDMLSKSAGARSRATAVCKLSIYTFVSTNISYCYILLLTWQESAHATGNIPAGQPAQDPAHTSPSSAAQRNPSSAAPTPASTPRNVNDSAVKGSAELKPPRASKKLTMAAAGNLPTATCLFCLHCSHAGRE